MVRRDEVRGAGAQRVAQARAQVVVRAVRRQISGQT
jgi:hypothetical protein